MAGERLGFGPMKNFGSQCVRCDRNVTGEKEVCDAMTACRPSTRVSHTWALFRGNPSLCQLSRQSQTGHSSIGLFRIISSPVIQGANTSSNNNCAQHLWAPSSSLFLNLLHVGWSPLF